MPNLQIIRQNSTNNALPDFRSLGVVLRVLLLCNIAGMMLSLMRAQSWGDAALQFMQLAALLQPVLLTCLLLFYVLNPVLARLSGWRGPVVVLGLVAVVTQTGLVLGTALMPDYRENGGFHLARGVIMGVAAAAVLLAYFRLRSQALAPATNDARLHALQARIRPHFLFNCINTVLSLVRVDQARAETALEDMSDLFRMAMAHDRELVPLREEIELSRRYLALEQLRLGERLRVNWRLEGLPDDALAPPLMLQPLLENAVYHGIEPLAEGGEIDIHLARNGSVILIQIRNPRSTPQGGHGGNKLALENIRERLNLLFDIEADYAVETGEGYYEVRITLPYVKGDWA